MALIPCPECGREVSSKAKACPSCAHPVAENGQAADKPGALQLAADVATGPLGCLGCLPCVLLPLCGLLWAIAL